MQQPVIDILTNTISGVLTGLILAFLLNRKPNKKTSFTLGGQHNQIVNYKLRSYIGIFSC